MPDPEMLMNLRPILSSLLRHRYVLALLVLQLALACAVIANAGVLAAGSLVPLLAGSGARDADNVLLIGNLMNNRLSGPVIAETREALAALPGVQSVADGTLPYLSGFRWPAAQVSTAADAPAQSVSLYLQRGIVDVLQPRLVAGRGFSVEEYRSIGFTDVTTAPLPAASCVISRALAQRLFGEAPAVGKPVYIRFMGQALSVTVVGVVDQLSQPDPLAAEHPAESVLLPVTVDTIVTTFALRVAPGQMDAVRQAVPGVLNRTIAQDQPINPPLKTLSEARAEYFGPARALLLLLGVLILVVVGITAMGLAGLTGYWIAQRRQQIGIRRALGARRADIVRHFQSEILLVGLIGVIIGAAVSVPVNRYLVQHFDVRPLQPEELLLAAALVVLISQLAAWWPTRRAARVSPLEATRPA